MRGLRISLYWPIATIAENLEKHIAAHDLAADRLVGERIAIGDLLVDVRADRNRAEAACDRIAALLGVSSEAVRQRYSRAVARLGRVIRQITRTNRIRR